MHFNFKRAQYFLQHYKIFKYHGNHENCNKILGYRIKAEQTSLSLRWSTSKIRHHYPQYLSYTNFSPRYTGTAVIISFLHFSIDVTARHPVIQHDVMKLTVSSSQTKYEWRQFLPMGKDLS